MEKTQMIKMKLIGILLCAVVIVSNSSFIFAQPKGFESIDNKSPIVESTDATYKIYDMGIFDMISNIQDPVKKQLILSYWTTPAFFESSIPSQEEETAILKNNYDTIIKLIYTPSELLEQEINKILSLNVITLSKDKNKKILPSFIEYLNKKSIDNTYLLEDQVTVEQGLQFIESPNLVQTNYAATTINSKTVTAYYGSGNAGSATELSITCKVNWSYDTTTKDITYLAPTTTYKFGATYMIMGYEKNEQMVVNAAIDRGLVHKSKIVYIYAPQTFLGHLMADVSVNGDGTWSKKYAALKPEAGYVYYTWSN